MINILWKNIYVTPSGSLGIKLGETSLSQCQHATCDTNRGGKWSFFNYNLLNMSSHKYRKEGERVKNNLSLNKVRESRQCLLKNSQWKKAKESIKI